MELVFQKKYSNLPKPYFSLDESSGIGHRPPVDKDDTAKYTASENDHSMVSRDHTTPTIIHKNHAIIET
jgi:hypothetical protein